MTDPRPTLHNPFTGERLTFLVRGKDTGGERMEAEVRLDPGGRVPLHVHLRVEERVTVEAGSVVVRVGGRNRELGVGDSLTVPRGNRHLLRNAGTVEAVIRMEVRPARHMELFMRGLFGVMSGLGKVLRRK